VSTNGIIARSTGEGTFEGVYHHWDSYPNQGLGQFLIRTLTGHFQNDLARMLRFLIDEYPAGWSTIVNKDFTLKPGYTAESLRHPSCSGMSDEDYHAAMERFRALPDYRRPQCYCHGKRHEEPQVLTEKSDVGASWAYVFDEQERILHVCNREQHRDTKAYFWNDTGSGGDSDFLRRSYNLPPLPPNTWIATVVYANGRRANLPVALRTPEGERPIPA